MKRILLPAIVFLTVNLYAQPYVPLLDSVNRWIFVGTQIGVIANDDPTIQSSLCSYYGWPFGAGYEWEYYTTGDSIVGSETYKIINRSAPSVSICLYGLIREDTASRKVYFLDNLGSPEMLLFDFSMQVGDTIYRDFLGSAGYYSDGDYKLLSITSISTLAGPRRQFELVNLGCTSCERLYWIEGVGCRASIAYLNGPNASGGMIFFGCQGFPYDYVQLLSCFSHDQKVFYDSCAFTVAYNGSPCLAYIDSCHYGNVCGSVDDLQVFSSLSVSPNPSTGNVSIRIELKTEAKVSIEVLDPLSNQVLAVIGRRNFPAGSHAVEADLGALPAGFYFLRCSSAGMSIARPVVIGR